MDHETYVRGVRRVCWRCGCSYRDMRDEERPRWLHVCAACENTNLPVEIPKQER